MFIGLTGGIACGKSLVAKFFQELGAHIIDADALAHQLLEPGQPGFNAIVEAFGPSILQTSETAGKPTMAIDRSRLGAIVFSDLLQRARLEAILHPLIFAEAARRRATIEADDPNALILFVAPLLFEAGADRRVDRTIAVVADEATQVSRLMARDGLSRNEALQRIRAQMPVADKQRRADDTIDGGRPPEEVRRQVVTLFDVLVGRRRQERTPSPGVEGQD